MVNVLHSGLHIESIYKSNAIGLKLNIDHHKIDKSTEQHHLHYQSALMQMYQMGHFDSCHLMHVNQIENIPVHG